jgi:hypothetical protein
MWQRDLPQLSFLWRFLTRGGLAITLAPSTFLEGREGKLKRALDLARQAEALFLELGSPKAEGARIDRVWLEYKMANEQM